jgi:hypothetical protein
VRNISRCIAGVVALAALTLAAPLCGGCAVVGTENTLTWERVASGHLSGERPGKLDLGSHDLSERTTVAWTSSAVGDASVRLTIRLEGVSHGYVHTETVPPGESALEGKASFSDLAPGEYRITFSQLFPRTKGSGNDLDVVVRTLR